MSINILDLPKDYQAELQNRMDAEMQRNLFSNQGLIVYEDEDHKFNKEFKLLNIPIKDREFELIIIQN